MIFTLVGHQYFILLGDSYLIFKPTSANGSHYATSCFVQKESLENIMGKTYLRNKIYQYALKSEIRAKYKDGLNVEVICIFPANGFENIPKYQKIVTLPCFHMRSCIIACHMLIDA